MIMIVKTPASQKGSPAAAEEGAEGRGGEGGRGGEKATASEVDVEKSTAPKATSRSREGVPLNEAPRILLRGSSSFRDTPSLDLPIIMIIGCYSPLS